MIAGLQSWLPPTPPADLWVDPGLPRFAAVLPQQLYEPASGLYGMPNGKTGEATGFLLEALPQVGVSEQLERTLQELPTLLPTGSCLQMTLYADPHVHHQLARFCRLRGEAQLRHSAGVHRQLARMRYDHLTGLRGEFAVCDFRLFIAVTLRGELSDKATTAQLTELRDTFISLLAGCSIPAVELQPTQLIDLLGGLLNPRHASRRGFSYVPDQYLNEQCLLNDTEIEVGTGRINVCGDGEPHALAVLTASQYPLSLRLPAMLGLLGDPVRPNLRYRGPFLITTIIQALDQEDTRMMVSLRAARAATNAKSVMAWLMPSHYRRQQQDWRTAAEVIDQGGHLVLMSHQVVVQAPPALLSSAIESARSVWRAQGFTLSRCEYLQVQGLLAALPLGLTPATAADLRKLGWLGRKTSHNAAHGMPVVAEWKGTRTPALLLVGRRGQLMNLDIFDAGGNYNAIIAGASGSGKSMLLNEIAATSHGQGAKVWVLDIGRSYQQSCEFLGGQFVQFGADNSMSLNPFSAIVDINEDMRLLTPLFAQMIAPRGGLSDYQRARLEEALLGTWERHQKDADPTAVRDELLRLGHSDPRVADMAAMLGPYAHTGVHAAWFSGPATIDFQADYVVLELEELKSRPELQVVVFLQLLFQISQQMYASHDRRKLVLIDEAWDLMRGEHIAEFIEHGYRRSRKYNGAFLSASQSVADFYTSPAGRAAMSNSDWLMLLKQKGEEISQLVEARQLDLDPAEQALVRSLHTQVGRYSEVFVRGSGMGSAVGRLCIDTYTQLLYSTRPADKQAIAAARANGHDLAAAVKEVLAQRELSHAAA